MSDQISLQHVALRRPIRRQSTRVPVMCTGKHSTLVWNFSSKKNEKQQLWQCNLPPNITRLIVFPLCRALPRLTSCIHYSRRCHYPQLFILTLRITYSTPQTVVN